MLPKLTPPLCLAWSRDTPPCCCAGCMGWTCACRRAKRSTCGLRPHGLTGSSFSPGKPFPFGNWSAKRPAKRDTPMISSGGFRSGVGGGLCQLANMVHWLVLNSPLTVTELHHHSDALFPDERRTVPFGTGTSVFYKNVDYQFRNTTDQPVQLLLWLDDTDCAPPSPSLTAIESSRRTADLSRRRMAGTGSARFTEG